MLALTILLATSTHAGTLQNDWGVPGDGDWEDNCNGAFSAFGSNHSDTPELGSCDPTQSDCLHKASVQTAAFPHAVCADGSPAAFFYRPGEGADTHRWVIRLQGGIRPDSDEELMERWCGLDAQQSASTLTSTSLPNVASSGGIHGGDVDNPFSDWNQVLAYSCSPDRWLGRSTGRSPDYTPSGVVPDVTVHERGHFVLRAFRKMLRQDGGRAWVPSAFASMVTCGPEDENTTSSPCIADLDDAEEILFAGSSSGGFGAMHSADWFLQRFVDDGAKVGLLVDGAAGGSHQALDDVGWTLDGGSLYDSPTVQAKLADQVTMQDVNAFIDADCDFIAECTDSDDLLLPWQEGPLPRPSRVSTPTFIRYDLEDSILEVTLAWAEDEGAMIDDGGTLRAPTCDDISAVARQSLLLAHVDGHLPSQVGSVTGVFGPAEGEHVGVDADDVFFDHETGHVPAAEGDGLATTVDAVWDWFDSGSAGFVPSKRVDAGVWSDATCLLP